jgi:chromosome segregation ATPase
MHGQFASFNEESDAVAFGRAGKGAASGEGDQLDRAGRTILQLLHKAADVAEENSRHALETAQRLSHQLRAAEDRIAELEADVEAYRARAERAEQWLDRIHGEIESQFLRRDDGSRRTPRAARQRG